MSGIRQSGLAALGVAVLLAACGKPATAESWPRYRDPHGYYSIAYPARWHLDAMHDYQALGPGKDIHGVAFKVAPKLTAGTNLSKDSYLAVEELPKATHCIANAFLDDVMAAPVREPGKQGIVWSVAHGSDAGAGNLYDESVYVVSGSKPCTAIRYFIHSTNIANYDPGAVKAFDETALTATFDKMRNSFRLR